MGRHGKDETAGLSRRELLQRSAVAGGIVWATPTLLASAAGAQTTVSCPQGSCPVYHAVKLNTGDEPLPPKDDLCSTPSPDPGETDYFTDASNANGLFCLDSDIAAIPDDAELVATSCATFISHVQSITHSGSTDTITLKPGYQFVAAYSKKSGCDDATSSTSCSVANFSDDSSHLEILYCGPS